MTTTNRNIVEKQAKKLGLELGCYNKGIEKLNRNNLKKVLDNMEFENDTDVFINRRLHVVEIDRVDNEIDLNILSKDEYIGRYGDDRWYYD